MTWKDRPVSAELGSLIIAVFVLAGIVVGILPGNGMALGGVALLYVAAALYYRGLNYQSMGEIEAVGMLALFACLVTALATTGVRLFVTTPGVPLMAFWLYALVAAGFMVSRCCLGWHVGASTAVLTSFVAVGLFVQSFYGGGVEWLAALIVAAGLWWGADSWRRANGLAINE